VGLLLASCGEEAASPAIVGDWFRCLEPDCSEVGEIGNRFGADGSFVSLYPVKLVLGPDDGYCRTSNPELIYRYAWDGQRLEIKDGQTILNSYSFTVEGDRDRDRDRADVDKAEWKEPRTMLRVSPPRERGPCSARTPWICPKFDQQATSAGSCKMRWVCDGGAHEVSCTASACTCGPTSGKSFKAAGACAMALGALYTAVNAGCGWSLALMPY
jgi:hypothetical protein